MAGSVDTAKLLALLALLDVLNGEGQMGPVGSDKIGPNDPRAGRAGLLRLKFTIFANDQQLTRLALELSSLPSEQSIMRAIESRIGRDDKLRLASQMISGWSEVLRRLVDMGDETPGTMALPPGQRSLPAPGGKP